MTLLDSESTFSTNFVLLEIINTILLILQLVIKREDPKMLRLCKVDDKKIYNFLTFAVQSNEKKILIAKYGAKKNK